VLRDNLQVKVEGIVFVPRGTSHVAFRRPFIVVLDRKRARHHPVGCLGRIASATAHVRRNNAMTSRWNDSSISQR